MIPYADLGGNCEFIAITYGKDLPLKSCNLYIV